MLVLSLRKGDVSFHFHFKNFQQSRWQRLVQRPLKPLSKACLQPYGQRGVVGAVDVRH